MVAAALAAMTVGAYAGVADAYNVYDLSISVKTTTGKAGSASHETEYSYYGKGEATDWWYNDDEFKTGGPFDEILVKNSKSDAKKHGEYTIKQKAIDGLTLEKQEMLKELLEDYRDHDPEDNGGAWCLRIKWPIPAACYRASASKSLKAYAISDSCCAEDWKFDVYAKSASLNNFILLWKDSKTVNYGTIDFSFLYRIGGIEEKATKVEGFAVADFVGGAFKDGSLWMAGQGCFDKKNALVKNVSGNVAGYLGASVCPLNCCESPYAYAYDCEGNDIDGIELGTIHTAAYGTWSLKYNASATKKLNAIED